MKLLARAPDRLVFRLAKREHEALLTTLRLCPLFPRQAKSITSDGADAAKLRAAQEDLDAALAEHRQAQLTALETLLADPERCAPLKPSGWSLVLSPADAEALLQALNEVRVGAWEKLGAPDFAAGERPKLTEENFLCLWAFQLSEVFQGVLLDALMGDDSGDGSG